MCGASDQQKEIEASQQHFYDVLTAHYEEAFGQSAGILKTLRAQLEPIVARGPDQEGFGPQEKTALMTQANEGTARNFQAATKAIQESRAARSGGEDFVINGQDTNIAEALGTTAAAAKSEEEQQIIMADYATGRELWGSAVRGLGGVAEEWNPTGSAGVANNAGGAAAETANQIAQADNSIWNAAVGALGGVASEAVGNWTQKSG